MRLSVRLSGDKEKRFNALMGEWHLNQRETLERLITDSDVRSNRIEELERQLRTAQGQLLKAPTTCLVHKEAITQEACDFCRLNRAEPSCPRCKLPEYKPKGETFYSGAEPKIIFPQSTEA